MRVGNYQAHLFGYISWMSHNINKSTTASAMIYKELEYGVGNISGNILRFCIVNATWQRIALYCSLRSYQPCINIKGSIKHLIFAIIFSTCGLFIIWNIFRHATVALLPGSTTLSKNWKSDLREFR